MALINVAVVVLKLEITHCLFGLSMLRTKLKRPTVNINVNRLVHPTRRDAFL